MYNEGNRNDMWLANNQWNYHFFHAWKTYNNSVPSCAAPFLKRNNTKNNYLSLEAMKIRG